MVGYNATIHVTNFLQVLKNMRKLSDEELIVRFGKGDKVQVEHIWSSLFVFIFLSCFEIKRLYLRTFYKNKLNFYCCFGP